MTAAPQTMKVTVPNGVGPGMIFMVQTPGGQQVQCQVPLGSGPGALLTIQVPVAVPQQPMMAVAPSPPVVQQGAYMVAQSPPLGVAPQPMVMQQSAPVAQQAAAPPVVEKPGMAPANLKTGKSGEKIFGILLSPVGEKCEGCCDRTASPIGQCEQQQKMPVELASKSDMSAAAWELILEKCIAWQKHVGLFCGIPGCEPFCLLTGGCCCACAVCLFCSYTGRTTFETETEAEINEMLKKYAIRAKFESKGMLFFMNVHLNFYWV